MGHYITKNKLKKYILILLVLINDVYGAENKKLCHEKGTGGTKSFYYMGTKGSAKSRIWRHGRGKILYTRRDHFPKLQKTIRLS